MMDPVPERPVPARPSDVEDDWQVVRRIGHDINNLLGAVVGYTEMLIEDTPTHAPYVSDLLRIHDSAQRATELVTALMAHARTAQVSDRSDSR